MSRTTHLAGAVRALGDDARLDDYRVPEARMFGGDDLLGSALEHDTTDVCLANVWGLDVDTRGERYCGERYRGERYSHPSPMLLQASS